MLNAWYLQPELLSCFYVVLSISKLKDAELFFSSNNNLNQLIMPTLVVRHKVGDFDAWLKGHDDRKRIFASAVSSFQTFQDTDDPKSVVLVLEVTDMEKLNSLMTDPSLQKDKDRHTVKDPIVISVPVNV